MSENHHDDDKTRTHVPLMKDTVVGHYRIVEKIGAGGMGEVYLAEDTELDRKVALKFLPHDLCQDEDCRARFKREAQAAAKLSHPHIITVFEVSEYKGRPFFAMEHVEGRSLKEFSSDKDLSIEQILELAIQICDGLHAAHEKGITHRDIKPSNILIDSYGRARIVDFGLASVVGKDQLTKTGSTLGTIGYMSPEQVRGQEIDHRTDLFSLGVVLYELITKQNPFKRDSEAATLKAVSDYIPEPLARFKSGLPKGLQSIIDKALEKDVKIRYQHADGMLSDLMRVKRSIESAQETTPRPPTDRSLSRSFWIASALIVIVVVIILIVTKAWQSESLSDKPDKIMLAVLPFENLGNPEDEYFSDGMTDEIISRLAIIENLGVIARTSSVRYKETEKDISEIARELGVEYILSGTVRWDRVGDTSFVRITPQLIRVSDKTQIWANSYERTLLRIFSIQAEIASEIADAMGVAISDNELDLIRLAPTDNFEAYNAYLRARELYWKADIDWAKMSGIVGLLDRAVTLDSEFVAAYAMLSIAHSGIYHYGFDRSSERLDLALEAARSALRINSELPDGHLALAWYYYRAQRDYGMALQELRSAEISGASEYDVCRLYATIYKRQGDFTTAIRYNQRALKSNPRDPDVLMETGVCYQWLRRNQEAVDLYMRMIESAPDQHFGYTWAATALYSSPGGLPEARRILEKIPGDLKENDQVSWYFQEFYERDTVSLYQRFKSSAWISTTFGMGDAFPKDLMIAWTHKYLGDASHAKQFFDSALISLTNIQSDRPNDTRVYNSLAHVYAGLGLSRQAMAYLDSARIAWPFEKDLLEATFVRFNSIFIFAACGNYEDALDALEYILANPSPWSVYDFIIDPRIDPLRDHPRFLALLKKYATTN